MNTLMGANNYVLDLIRERMDLFDSFEHVYLFGSTLKPDTFSHDIDILVIYKEHSRKIAKDMSTISDALGKASGMLIDLTTLSIAEEKDTMFLERIKPYYWELK